MSYIFKNSVAIYFFQWHDLQFDSKYYKPDQKANDFTKLQKYITPTGIPPQIGIWLFNIDNDFACCSVARDFWISSNDIIVIFVVVSHLLAN